MALRSLASPHWPFCCPPHTHPSSRLEGPKGQKQPSRVFPLAGGGGIFLLGLRAGGGSYAAPHTKAEGPEAAGGPLGPLTLAPSPAVAIQCLETAFGVSLEDRSLVLSQTLPEIFEAAAAKVGACMGGGMSKKPLRPLHRERPSGACSRERLPLVAWS